MDDVFAYSTTKQIKIRDARLGLLHYSLMFFITVYIVVYQLICKLGYLRFAAASSTVRLTLQEPTLNGCNPNDSNCKDNFIPLGQLPYCCAQNSSCTSASDGSCRCDYRKSFKNYNCTWLGGDDAATVQESAIMVTTFTHEYTLTRNPGCFTSYPAGNNSCDKVWLVQDGPKTFTADIEAYTILIDHSVASPGVSLTSREMDGFLYVGAASGSPTNAQKARQDALCQSDPTAVDAPLDGSPTSKSPCYVAPGKVDGLDFFKVEKLLAAAGVSLEEESYPGSGHSARYDGLVMNLIIEYSNTERWKGIRPVSYVYVLSEIPQSTYKLAALLPGSSQQERVKKDMHGVLFEVRPGGSLAVFDFTQLLLQLTTSLTLLAMATVGVNILAQNVLRLRHYYSEAMHDDTSHFRNLSFLERQPDALIEEELRSRNLPEGGTKYRKIMRLLEYGWSLRPGTSFVASAQEGSSGGVDLSNIRPET